MKDKAAYQLWTKEEIDFDELKSCNDVDNGAINRCFERGRVWFRGEHFAQLAQESTSCFVLIKCTIDYRESLSCSADIELGATITRLGGSSYTLAQGIFIGDRCIATAHSIFARMSPDSGRAMPLDESFKEALRQATGFEL